MSVNSITYPGCHVNQVGGTQSLSEIDKFKNDIKTEIKIKQTQATIDFLSHTLNNNQFTKEQKEALESMLRDAQREHAQLLSLCMN